MRRLVSIAEAMFHLKYDVEPPELPLMVDAASAAVLNYLGNDATFLTPDGQVDISALAGSSLLAAAWAEGAWSSAWAPGSVPNVPYEVKAACLIWLAAMDLNRAGEVSRAGETSSFVDSRFGYGYPPAAVVSLLSILRSPRLA